MNWPGGGDDGTRNRKKLISGQYSHVHENSMVRRNTADSQHARRAIIIKCLQGLFYLEVILDRPEQGGSWAYHALTVGHETSSSTLHPKKPTYKPSEKLHRFIATKISSSGELLDLL